MAAVKTNERPGTRAVAKYVRISAYKVREVLDLIRGEHVQRAAEILRFSERDAAIVIGKVLGSAVANAENNDGIDPEDLYVAACYADEGVTIRRFRPRARGRAGKIRKRTCHITVIVARMPDDELRRYRAKASAEQAARRARRVAGGRRGDVPDAQESTGQNRPGRFRRGGKRGGDASEEAALMTDEAAEVVEESAADVADSTEVSDAAAATETTDTNETSDTVEESTTQVSDEAEAADATAAVETDATDAADATDEADQADESKDAE